MGRKREIACDEFSERRQTAICLLVYYHPDLNRHAVSRKVVNPEHCLLKSSPSLNHIVVFRINIRIKWNPKHNIRMLNLTKFARELAVVEESTVCQYMKRGIR